MFSPETQRPGNRQMDLVRSAWNKIRAHLETERDRIYEEIRSYPTPIAACDQQFNYLLEKHTGVLRELAQLDEAAGASLTVEDPIEAIDKFIRSSRYVDVDAQRTIRSSLNAGDTQRQP